MTKLRILSLFAVILLLPLFSLAQFTRQQAQDLVINQILAADTGHITIYSSIDTILNTDSLLLLNANTIHLPYASSWVFLSNDNPYANWSHPCRYIFVNSNTGDYTIVNNNIYPISLNTNYEVILQPILPPVVLSPCSYTNPTYASPNSHLHAVLIGGWDQVNFNNDISVVYNMLREAGYIKHNIKVLFGYGSATQTLWGDDFDNDGYSEINSAAYHGLIDTAFMNLTESLGPQDQLFVYVASHGEIDATGPGYIIIPMRGSSSSDKYTTDDLVSAVRNINCAQMIFTMNQCTSGAFVYPLLHDTQNSLCKNRIVQTGAGDQTSDLAHTERYITHGAFDEFTYYWCAAMRGYYPGDRPWKWGCPVGSFPFSYFTTWGQLGHPSSDYNPDNGDPSAYDNNGNVEAGNSDGFFQFYEAFNYANCMDSWSTYGYYNPDLSVPDRDWIDTPMTGIDNGFSGDDLFCINGIAGKTSQPNEVASRSYLLGGNLNANSDLTIDNNVMMTIGVDNTIIDVGQNSKISGPPNNNKTIYKFILYGASGNATTNGLLIENAANSLDLENATFNEAYLQSYGSALTIGYNYASTFNNCPFITSERGTVNINNTTFNNSTLYLIDNDQSLTNSATVTASHFYQTTPIEALRVEDYKKYSIQNNIINGYNIGLYGIELYYCGSAYGNHVVQNNTIYNCYWTGLEVYSSDALIKNNKIFDNRFGIELLNNSSNTSIVGDVLLPEQAIYDCSENELFATTSCFPLSMIYNNISNSNPQTTLVYYDNKCSGTPPTLNVKFNCWGGDVQDPSSMLFANCGVYKWYPIWCQDVKGGGGGLMSPDEIIYNNAMSDDSIGDYNDAINLFRTLVETYPKSDYAKASMKAMFKTESYAGNEFSDLKTFYLTNDSILADTSLAQLGDFLANECDVAMQNYGDAIAWYENRIQNSTDPNDSVFAIIDLGHLYTIMDTTGNKSMIIGSMPQYKPTSKAKYAVYRDSLISLLPFSKDPLKRSIVKLQTGQVLQNVPNPANSSTDFYFKLYGATNAEIKIYDSWGQLKQVIPITTLSDGTQKVTFDTSTLPVGIYEYSLSINEKRTDTKKMVVMR